MKKILVALLCVGLFVGCSKKVIKVEETISKPSKIEKVATVEPKIENKVVIRNIYPKEQVQFEPIYFDFDSKILTKEAFATLEKIAPVLNKSNSTIIVEGYTDEQGSNEYNMGLSEDRAISVRHYFISYGIDEKRIDVIGFGEEKLVNENCGDDLCHSKNRRVDFKCIIK